MSLDTSRGVGLRHCACHMPLLLRCLKVDVRSHSLAARELFHLALLAFEEVCQGLLVLREELYCFLGDDLRFLFRVLKSLLPHLVVSLDEALERIDAESQGLLVFVHVVPEKSILCKGDITQHSAFDHDVGLDFGSNLI